MKCHSCGSQLDGIQSHTGASQDIDELLHASVEKALRKTRCCPECNQPLTPPSLLRRIRKGLLAAFLVTTGLILPVSAYLRSPMRTAIARQAITRAAEDSRVKKLLGEGLEPGSLISGAIKADDMGWRDADL